MHVYLYIYPSIICPPIVRHPHLTAMVFHLQKFNYYFTVYLMFNFTLFYPSPLLSANTFTSPKGGR